MNILVLGASGMLGNAMIRLLGERKDWQVFGTIRAENSRDFFEKNISDKLFAGIDAGDQDSLVQVFKQSRPQVVINCVGLVKQLDEASDPLRAILINSMLPHRLAALCQISGARLLHISTDCVFSGNKQGGYRESDIADANDLYGRTKLLGEVSCPHALTIRTSMIGHELQGNHGLVGWFLSQQGQCKGYTKAIFSGLPTVVLAQIVRDVIIPRSDLSGIYHVAAQAISKYELLKLIADEYGKLIEVVPDAQLTIDRSLNADRFRADTGYVAPDWRSLIKSMRLFQ